MNEQDRNDRISLRHRDLADALAYGLPFKPALRLIRQLRFGQMIQERASSGTWPKQQPGSSQAAPEEIALRLFVGVLLFAILVFRRRKFVRGFVRSLYVAETEKPFSVFAAALMLIVGDRRTRSRSSRQSRLYGSG